MIPDMRSYLELLSKKNELAVIKKRVSTKFEIAAVTAKMDGSKALLFENIRNSKFRVVTNLVGTRKRFAYAVGSNENKIHEKVISAIKHTSKPKVIEKAKFLENQSRDLFALPIITHFEKEPGPFITSSIIYTKNQEMNTQNSSFNRLLRIDEKHFSIRMVEGRHLHRTFVYAKEHGEDLKVAISIGVHPAVSIAGAYQADWGKDELEIANELLNKKLNLSLSPYAKMHVPSESEIIIEGRILKDKIQKEWMVEMLRTYDFKRDQPIFELDRIYYRNNPIYHDVLAGFSEHQLLMGMPIEAKINKELKKVLPQTRNVVLTEGGCKWLHAVVQISKKRDSDPKKAINTVFSAHRSLKNVIVVDEDIDPNDPIAVEYAIATRFQADKDLVIISKVRGSSLDPSSDQKNLLTAKMGVDATRSFSKRAEGFEIAKIPGAEKISLKSYLK